MVAALSKQRYKQPHILYFPALGMMDTGYLSVVETENNIPFKVKRMFWVYNIPESGIRGNHAHYKNEQILLAVKGEIVVTTEDSKGVTRSFTLNKPNEGLYILPNIWHFMEYSGSAVQIVLASHPYSESDYIRDYNNFKEVWK